MVSVALCFPGDISEIKHVLLVSKVVEEPKFVNLKRAQVQGSRYVGGKLQCSSKGHDAALFPVIAGSNMIFTYGPRKDRERSTSCIVWMYLFGN